MPDREMKAVVFALIVLVFMIPLQADILVNGDFADGHAHWKGDAKDPDPNSGDLSNPTPLAGVTITLRKDKWTKIYQYFTTREKKLHYSITFTLSSDYKPDRDQPRNAGFAPTPGLDDIIGVPIYYGDPGGDWMCILAQAGMGSSSFPIHPNPKKTDPQTFRGVLRGAPGEDPLDMTLVFAFPPGQGTITLTSISMTGGDN